MTPTQRKPSGTSNRYLNLVLTVIAVLLGVIAIDRGAMPAESDAIAQRSNNNTPNIPFNATEQRIKMIRSLEAIDGRLTKIENKLTKGGIEVKVTEMPPIIIPE